MRSLAFEDVDYILRKTILKSLGTRLQELKLFDCQELNFKYELKHCTSLENLQIDSDCMNDLFEFFFDFDAEEIMPNLKKLDIELDDDCSLECFLDIADGFKSKNLTSLRIRNKFLGSCFHPFGGNLMTELNDKFPLPIKVTFKQSH